MVVSDSSMVSGNNVIKERKKMKPKGQDQFKHHWLNKEEPEYVSPEKPASPVKSESPVKEVDMVDVPEQKQEPEHDEEGENYFAGS